MKLSTLLLACLLLFSPAAKASTDLTCEVAGEWKMKIVNRVLFLEGEAVKTDDWQEEQMLDWEVVGLTGLYARIHQWTSFNCIEM